MWQHVNLSEKIGPRDTLSILLGREPTIQPTILPIASVAEWLRRPPREQETEGSLPAYLAQVTPVELQFCQHDPRLPRASHTSGAAVLSTRSPLTSRKSHQWSCSSVNTIPAYLAQVTPVELQFCQHDPRLPRASHTSGAAVLSTRSPLTSRKSHQWSCSAVNTIPAYLAQVTPVELQCCQHDPRLPRASHTSGAAVLSTRSPLTSRKSHQWSCSSVNTIPAYLAQVTPWTRSPLTSRKSHRGHGSRLPRASHTVDTVPAYLAQVTLWTRSPLTSRKIHQWSWSSVNTNFARETHPAKFVHYTRQQHSLANNSIGAICPATFALSPQRFLSCPCQSLLFTA